ncbi:unnamed protein product [Brachionus calyciflorus]|uniref:phosphatidate phosphatase n=1 Tax=Brachionus calyciflorus TaxID=104777 RepID=A0A813MES4_9BILA|nr:unnamed protein product [Brachionus calyciflorus]
MGNQQGAYYIDEDDSGIYNPQELFNDSLTSLEQNFQNLLSIDTNAEFQPLKNSTPKKTVLFNENINREEITCTETRKKSLTKSKSISFKNRLDSSSGYSISSSEDDNEIRSKKSILIDNFDKNNFIYSSTWSPDSNCEPLKHSKSFSVDLIQKYPQAETSGYFRRGMEIFGKVAKNIKGFYNDINSATLTGAIDVVVVEQEDGSFKGSPFHVRFGKLGVIRSKERVVDIEINGEPVEDLHMKLGEAGEAYFLEPIDSDDEPLSNEPILSSTSSLPSLKTSKTTSDLEQTNSTQIKTVQTISDISQYNNKKEELPTKLCESIPIKIPSEKSINFFSDGEITPEMTSPSVSRPATPKSDTELEVNSSQSNKHKRNSINQENQWNWDWGQFPERQDSLSKKDIQHVKNDLLNEKKKLENSVSIKGKYLDELDDNEVDLYLNQKSQPIQKLSIQTKVCINKIEDDQDSGKGFSVPQSPRDPLAILGDIQLSLCGFVRSNLVSPIPKSPNDLLSVSPSNSSTSVLAVTPNQTKNYLEIPQDLNEFDDLFQQNLLTWEKFCEDMSNWTQNPNLVIKLNGRYMNWSCASPIILSAIVYHKQLSNEQINTILEANMPKITKTAQQNNEGGKRSSWFFWPTGNKTTQITNTPKLESVKSSSTLLTTIVKEEVKEEIKETDTLIFEADFENKTHKQKFRKTTRLSSEQIKKLNLNPGLNEIKYSVTTPLQGTTRISSYIFLWNYDDKIIVSDIDGTITKSDVWGQVLPLFGKDWTQSGVADLFTAIERNEYKFMYLSARAIGQSQITRNLLTNVYQNGFKLPFGPLLVTPTSLFTAFQKEVIERKPEEFKIQCLKDIQSLFPSYHNPFHAGYGNRTNDVTAYKAVGMDVSRIFTINPQGEVKHEVSRTFQSSYSKLCDYVDLIFPSYKMSKAVLKPEYDTYNYWRPSIGLTDDVLAEMEMEVKKTVISGKAAKDTKLKDTKDNKKDLKKT